MGEENTKPSTRSTTDSVENKTKNQKNNNTPVIVLLVILIAAVLGVGGYFIAKDIISNNSPSQNQSQTTNSQNAESNTAPNNPTNITPAENGASSEATSAIEAGITYAEKRGNEFYVEVQTNGVVAGECVISLTPTSDPTLARTETDDLEPFNKVSLCD